MLEKVASLSGSSSRRRSLKLNLFVLLAISTIFLFSYITHAEKLHNPFVHGFDDQQTLNSGDSFAKNAHKKRNIIMMVTDGTGPAAINMARYFKQYQDDLPYDDILTIDKYLIGSSRTRSSSSLITDSAAGATAFSCALKSYNGAIGVDADKNPCGTILEALKLKGYKTGLVVTTSLTDATPAAFNSHVDYRFMQSLIANQQLGFNNTLGEVTDLMIGGGRCFYLPGSDVHGCRDDETNLIEIAKSKGYNVATNKEEFDQWQLGKNVTLPILSVLAYYNIPYEIDRDSDEHPSLYEEAVTALNVLSESTKDSDEGFFLMIEGSRIDHAGHQNDPAAQVREVLAYDKAFKAVIDFADSTDVETFIISTSDHETGGLAVGRQVTPGYPDYLWKPDSLLNAKKSGEYLVHKLNSYVLSEGDSNLTDFIRTEIFEKDLGILDYSEDDVEEVAKLKDQAQDYLNNMVSIRAQIGWSTHGHTAVDVNIYGYSNTEHGKYLLREYLGGNRENTDVGKFMEFISNSDLDYITKLLKDDGQQHTPTVEELEEEINVSEVEEGFIDHMKEIPQDREED